MNDEELLRYSRHILLDAIGIEGQERFRRSHLLVVGAGGLGCAAALYLGAAGIGTLSLVDDDIVDLTNLQRQVAHTVDRIGQSKVASLASAIAAINPLVRVQALHRRADPAWLAANLPGIDLVLDCTDNFATRQSINAACVFAGKPLVSGAALGFDGQLALFDPRNGAGPCYACVFPPGDQVEEAACSSMGVFAPLVGMVGTAQAALALQWLLADAGGVQEVPSAARLSGILRMVDARSMEWTRMRLSRHPGCPVCGDASTPPFDRGQAGPA